MQQKQIIKNRGNVLSCSETFTQNILKIYDTSKIGFCKDDMCQSFNAMLTNFGALCMKPDMGKDKEKTIERAENIIKERLLVTPDNAFTQVDNAIFQILSARFPNSESNFMHLADMYSTFVSDMVDFPNNNFFHIDLNTISGISPELSEKVMGSFLDLVCEKCNKKGNDQTTRVHFIYHCNNPIAYKSFINFAKDHNVMERLGSHRYGVGGMVALSFNKPELKIRTYLYPLFEVINNERDYLDKGGRVYYHILGVSSIYDQFAILMIQKYLDSIGWNLDISFDSSTSLSLPVRGRRCFHVDNDKRKITLFSIRESDLNDIPNSTEPNLTNKYYIQELINKINDNIPILDGMKLDPDHIEDFFDVTSSGASKNSIRSVYYSVGYSYWSYDQMYRLIERIVNESDITTEENRLEVMVKTLNNSSMGISNMMRFNKTIFRNINTSYEMIKSFVEKKINIEQVRTQGLSEVFANSSKLAYTDDVVL